VRRSLRDQRLLIMVNLPLQEVWSNLTKWRVGAAGSYNNDVLFCSARPQAVT